MKLNIFGREITLKKQAVVAGTAILLLLGCLAGYIFLRQDNDIIIEAGSDQAGTYTTGTAITADVGGNTAPGSLSDAPADGVPAMERNVPAEGTICVYVVGCVKQPGIVTIKKGQLINDAVMAAGGLTSEADAGNINLVYSLNENVMLNIKSKQKPEQTDASKQPAADVKNSAAKKPGEATQDTSGNPNAGLGSGAELISESGSGAVISGGSAAGGSIPLKGSGKNLVNINTAEEDELDTLPGVGAATAREIIAFREKNGKFIRIEDIMKVPRIKQSRFDSIRDYITVD